MSQDQWYYSKDGVHEGPVDRKEIVRLIENGVLTPAVLVCRKGSMAWEPIRDVPSFQQTEIYPGGKPQPEVSSDVPGPVSPQAVSVGGDTMPGGSGPAAAAEEDRMPGSPVGRAGGGTLMSTLNKWPKPVFFGLVGAVGCFIGAIIGQLFLLLFPSTPPAPVVAPTSSNIAILIDTSGSMNGGPLAEVKRAATQFVERQRTNKVKIAILHFDSNARVDQPLTTRTSDLVRAINGLGIGGSTSLDLGLEKVRDTLPSAGGSGGGQQKDFVLVFTDGQPDDESSALTVARELRGRAVNILVVHTAGAPHGFLVSLTGDANQVFSTSSGNFGVAFAKAESVINMQLGIATTNIEGRPVLAFLSNGGWFAVLAIALSFALALAQNSTMMVVNEGRIFQWGQAMICCLIGLLAGLAAGIGNALFQRVSEDNQLLSHAGVVVAWIILGGAIGVAMVFVILNFKPSRAIVGGLIGGLVGGLVFTLLRYLGSELGGSGSAIAEIVGRLLGAVMVGAMVGCFIAVVEHLSREAYIVIHWAPNETSTLNLGQQPVTIGGREDKVFVSGVPDGALSIVLNEGKIICTQQPGNTQSQLKDQSSIDLGNVKIVVHAKS